MSNFDKPMIPFGDPKEQKEFLELLKKQQKMMETQEKHPDSVNEHQEFQGDKNPTTGEVGGPKGKEPTRYGDWERNGRVYDF